MGANVNRLCLPVGNQLFANVSKYLCFHSLAIKCKQCVLGRRLCVALLSLHLRVLLELYQQHSKTAPDVLRSGSFLWHKRLSETVHGALCWTGRWGWPHDSEGCVWIPEIASDLIVLTSGRSASGGCREKSGQSSTRWKRTLNWSNYSGYVSAHLVFIHIRFLPQKTWVWTSELIQ